MSSLPDGRSIAYSGGCLYIFWYTVFIILPCLCNNFNGLVISFWWRFCVVTLLFGFFCPCRGFCHRTESDLFLFLMYMYRFYHELWVLSKTHVTRTINARETFILCHARLPEHRLNTRLNKRNLMNNATSRCYEQNRESTKGYSRWKVE